MIKACIFDMDGVIVDTAVYHFQAWKRMADELGFDLDEAFNEKLKGLSRVDSLEKILEEGDLVLDSMTKHKLMEKKNAWYLELVEAMTPKDVLDGTIDFFEQLQSAKIKIALGSSSKNARKILELANLNSYFDVVVDGSMITFSKPDPEVFLKGAAKLNILPAEAVVFEDAIAGIEAAKSGGFAVVGIGDAITLKGADFVVPSLKQMNLDLLRKFGSLAGDA
jgi:beta-phosphoglucomutase